MGDVVVETLTWLAERDAVVLALRNEEARLEGQLARVRSQLSQLDSPWDRRSLTDRVLAFIHANPGCSSRQLAEAFGKGSAATLPATLAVRGLVRRKRVDGIWRYFFALSEVPLG